MGLIVMTNLVFLISGYILIGIIHEWSRVKIAALIYRLFDVDPEIREYSTFTLIFGWIVLLPVDLFLFLKATLYGLAVCAFRIVVEILTGLNVGP